MKYPEIFKQYFVENFIELSEDKVPNVRITLAKVVKKHYIKKGNEFSTKYIKFDLLFRENDG